MCTIRHMHHMPRRPLRRRIRPGPWVPTPHERMCQRSRDRHRRTTPTRPPRQQRACLANHLLARSMRLRSTSRLRLRLRRLRRLRRPRRPRTSLGHTGRAPLPLRPTNRPNTPTTCLAQHRPSQCPMYLPQVLPRPLRCPTPSTRTTLLRRRHRSRSATMCPMAIPTTCLAPPLTHPCPRRSVGHLLHLRPVHRHRTWSRLLTTPRMHRSMKQHPTTVRRMPRRMTCLRRARNHGSLRRMHRPTLHTIPSPMRRRVQILMRRRAQIPMRRRTRIPMRRRARMSMRRRAKMPMRRGVSMPTLPRMSTSMGPKATIPMPPRTPKPMDRTTLKALSPRMRMHRMTPRATHPRTPIRILRPRRLLRRRIPTLLPTKSTG